MSVFQLLLLALVLVPLVEIYLLLQVGGLVGALPTIALVILTAVVGAALIRLQGFATINKVQTQLQAGEPPAIALLEGAFILVAGALLLTPGFLTDSIGFLCLIPPLRQWLIVRTLAQKMAPTRPGQPGARGRIIDAEFTRKEE